MGYDPCMECNRAVYELYRAEDGDEKMLGCFSSFQGFMRIDDKNIKNEEGKIFTFLEERSCFSR